ncbi:hypothetical protein B296_00036795 [Ensete ventricosum]|uniref:Uncharacterized protein n=1 Tax=Ensete ventricosum TaxID=4639 RepID=A0A426X9P7_ENSVE|nr:hypothetical protein B296_00036795 [Ensete ventricosum]
MEELVTFSLSGNKAFTAEFGSTSVCAVSYPCCSATRVHSGAPRSKSSSAPRITIFLQKCDSVLHYPISPIAMVKFEARIRISGVRVSLERKSCSGRSSFFHHGGRLAVDQNPLCSPSLCLSGSELEVPSGCHRPHRRGTLTRNRAGRALCYLPRFKDLPCRRLALKEIDSKELQ